jgi:hypothetical protein
MSGFMRTIPIFAAAFAVLSLLTIGAHAEERGARNMVAQAGLIAVSIHSSNVKPRFRETGDFVRAIYSQAMPSHRSDDIGVDW